MTNSGNLLIYSMRDRIQLDPVYQRLGEVWTLEKKQLLIDSIINGFDIPKLYFHEFVGPKVINRRNYEYAIVDGKQRLSAIWQFIENDFALADDFTYLHDETVQAAGMTYSEMSEEYHSLKIFFDQVSLPIFTIQTQEIELIEELFSRLNEAVPLNSAEKRNAWPGRAPSTVRKLAKHSFFVDCLPFKNKRYKHFDIAAKFLLFEERDGPTDTKKVYVDRFFREMADEASDLTRMRKDSESVLDAMASLFTKKDKLLASAGMISLYYLLMKYGLEGSWSKKVTRAKLTRFNEERAANRERAEADLAEANYDLIEFDRLSQSPNDGIAIEFRLETLMNYFGYTMEDEEA